MEKVAKFEKVSYEEYKRAIFDEYSDVSLTEEDRAEIEDYAENNYQKIQLPKRSTTGSAGYDIRIPSGIGLPAGATLKIPTGIRVKIDEGWWFAVVPRSSLGFKYRLQLDNTIGVVDSDYYYADNEGHIFLKLTNDSREGKTLRLEENQAICQGIFIPYGITYDDCVDTKRTGGLGSTT